MTKLKPQNDIIKSLRQKHTKNGKCPHIAFAVFPLFYELSIIFPYKAYNPVALHSPIWRPPFESFYAVWF